MARKSNRVATEQISVTISPTIKAYLELLTDRGFHGANPAATASDLLKEKIHQMVIEEQVPEIPTPSA